MTSPSHFRYLAYDSMFIDNTTLFYFVIVLIIIIIISFIGIFLNLRSRFINPMTYRIKFVYRTRLNFDSCALTFFL